MELSDKIVFRCWVAEVTMKSTWVALKLNVFGRLPKVLLFSWNYSPFMDIIDTIIVIKLFLLKEQAAYFGTLNQNKIIK